MANPAIEGHSLDRLKVGETAVVTALHAQGSERNRLMDLGILVGTRITAELVSPLGDPIAYRVRGALIALRRSQTRLIEIASEEDEA